jgi:hypothetical protein
MELAYKRTDDVLCISLCNVTERDESYALEKEELFVGYPHEIPPRFLYLEAAIAAVIQKSECAKCTHIHYGL